MRKHLLLCLPPQVDTSVINGRVVVHEGRLQTVDLPALVMRHNRLSKQLIRGE